MKPQFFLEYAAKRGMLNMLCWPLSLLYTGLCDVRRFAYQKGFLKQRRFVKPVVVIGNITLGGTGKTPLTITLANFLKSKGLRVGLVSRGYQGQANHQPTPVYQDSDPALVGDEALLLVRRTQCPMVIARKRVQAVTMLLHHYDCDVVLSDDGLQHYALHRDIEIAVIDGSRGLGNGWCFPAGMLRERPSRLKHVDWVIAKYQADALQVQMDYTYLDCYCLNHKLPSKPLDAFQNMTVHAVAAIADPSKFFQSLQQIGLNVIEHHFTDHHAFTREDLVFADDYPILMTEKDAVKCEAFAFDNVWVVPIQAVLPEAFLKDFFQAIKTVIQLGGAHDSVKYFHTKS